MLPKFFKPKSGAREPVEEAASPSDLIQQIGRAALDAAHSFAGKVLLYAEVDDGVISANLFSQAGNDPEIDNFKFRYPPKTD